MTDSVQYRKSPRANWIDYNYGTYLVTICTKHMIPYFGKIYNGNMYLSDIGKIVKNELENTHIHHPEIEISLYVVMPNHIHAIIHCDNTIQHCDNMPAEQRNPNPAYRNFPEEERHVPMLSKYVAALKSAVSKQAHIISVEFAWQPRYHDHLIRGNADMTKITDYIINNPLNWRKDCFYTDL